MAAVTPADSADTRPADLRRLARGSSINLAGSVVSAAVNLLVPVIITRRLSIEGAGTFFSVTALFAILLGVGTLGADTGVLWSLPRAKALGRQLDIPALVRLALVPVALVSLVTAGVVVLFAQSIAELISGGSVAQRDVFVSALYVLAPFLPVAAVYGVFVSASRGLGSIKPLVLIEKIGRNTLQSALVGLALALAPSVLLAVAAWAAPYAAALGVMGLTVLRLVRLTVAGAKTLEHSKSVGTLAREFWRFSGPRAFSRIFGVALQRFDILLVGSIRGLHEAAIYAAASRFLLFGLMFVQAIQQVMAPRISEFLARDDIRRAQTIYETTTAWLMLISWPLYMISAAFAPFLLRVFGSDYSSGAAAVVVLSLAMLVATACGPVDTVLLMGGRSRWSLLNTGLALLVNVSLDLILIPRFGIVGAAAGWAAGIAMSNLVPLYQVHRFLGMHPFGVATRRTAVITTACFGSVCLLGRVLLGATLTGCVAAIVLGGMAYLLCLWLQRDALDLEALMSVARRRRRT